MTNLAPIALFVCNRPRQTVKFLLINQLAKKNSKIIGLERLAVKQQAELYVGFQLLSPQHGTGLANSDFCEPRGKIIEILSWGQVSIIK